MKDLLKIAVTIFLTGFGLNLVWEVNQSLLFFDFPLRDLQLFTLINLKATVADAAYIILIYLLITVLTRDMRWFCHLTFFTASISMACGFIIAVLIEKSALKTGRWTYGHLMPIIPYLKVGLMPIIQVTVLPLATFIISQRLLSHWKEHSQLCPYGRDC